MTEDDLDFCRCNLSDNKLPDVNFPDKEWGYIVIEDNSFSFIGPYRPCPDIKYVQDYIEIAHMFRNTGLPNYRLVRIPIPWELHLQGYSDTRLIHYLKFGFHLSIKNHCNFVMSEVKNHFSAVSHKQAVQEYLEKEILAGAIIRPFDIVPPMASILLPF